MIPLIVMAAASILANKQKQSQEKKQLYLQQLEKNAQRMGGNTDLAEIYSGENAINQQGADYSSMLGLVGKGAESLGSGDDDDFTFYGDDPRKYGRR